jgi:hypothetical protein
MHWLGRGSHGLLLFNSACGDKQLAGLDWGDCLFIFSGVLRVARMHVRASRDHIKECHNQLKYDFMAKPSTVTALCQDVWVGAQNTQHKCVPYGSSIACVF